MTHRMEALRQIPPINDVLRSAELADFRTILSTPFASRLVEQVVGELRSQLANSQESVPRPLLTQRIAAEVALRLGNLLRPSLRRVINASGVLLHTNLGRAPLPAGALDHLSEVSKGYSNLEFGLNEGARGVRDEHIERLLRELLGCESAIVVNNNAAAVLLILNALAGGGDVIASRGEQIEIGGSFRIPEVMTKSGARLREVGTTNRTRIQDYEAAIDRNTRLLLRVHPSNFRIDGFSERPTLSEFVELGRRRKIPTCEDLGSGLLVNFAEVGLRDEPIVGESIRQGVDIVCFSGDKLLGGPQAGIIAGKKPLVEMIRRNPLFRALRVDKLVISVLEWVLLSYLKGDGQEIPLWSLLSTPAEQIRLRAEGFAARVGAAAQVVKIASVVGGGSAPQTTLPSWGVQLRIGALSCNEIERRLRASDPPVIARIDEERVTLDFRTVFAADEAELLRIVTSL